MHAAQRLLTHPRKLALALGGLAATGFEPLGLWPLALAAIALQLELIARADKARDAFLLGWLFGAAHFVIGLNWIVTAFGYQAAMPGWLGWIAEVGLSLYLAVWCGLAMMAAWRIARGRRHALVLAMAGCWIIGEWLRGWVFTGFPWNPLGALTLISDADPHLAYLAKGVGTYALSGLVVLLAGAWMLALHRGRRDWRAAALVMVPPVLFLIPTAPAVQPQGKLPYTLVQPDARQDDLHDPARFEATFQRAMGLSQAAVRGQNRVVLWPESALPDYLQAGYPAGWYASTTYGGDPLLARERIGRLIGPGSLLITGNDRLELENGRVVGARAGITAIDGQGQIRATYDKAHLVPYGEYVPMKWLLVPLGIDRLVPGEIEFWPGPGPRTIDLGAWGKIGMQLCYEIIFPGKVTEPGRRPDFIFNPSNDGWYGDWGPPQHLAQARLRAIEEGLPVLRSTTTGVSAVIDSDGVIRQSIPLRRAARRDGMVPPAAEPTPFARLGNGLSLAWAILLLALSVVACRRQGR
jgi:apolipoprotein N-acyltransferase